VTAVALVKVVGTAVPFHCTTESAVNPEPVKVICVEAPIGAPSGAINVNAGTGELATTGAVMASVAAADEPPPGAGFTTVMAALPTALRSAAVSMTFNCVTLT
jgi:hypothetical protein